MPSKVTLSCGHSEYNRAEFELYPSTRRFSHVRVSYEKICATPGTYGDPVNTTCDITISSKIISNVADMDGIGPGVYLKINSIIRRVMSIVNLTSFTVDQAMPSTASGVTIEDAVPVFVNLVVTP